MELYNFDIVAPVIDKKKPFYLENRKSLVFRLDIKYNYYVECSQFNEDTQETDYYLLLSQNKFNDNCRKLQYDNYGRYKAFLHDKFREYVSNESKNRGNIDLEYIESTEEYDIFSIN